MEHIESTSEAHADGGSRTTTHLRRRLVVLLLSLTAMMGCSLLQGEQARHPQSQPQSQPPGATSTAGGHPSIVFGTATGAPGQDVPLTATLHAAGTRVAGTQNDLTFDAANASMGTSGKPACRVNTAIGKGATAFSFRPGGCQGTACSSVRALVFSVDNTDPIPDGAPLYTCTLHISPSAPAGKYSIKVSGVILSTPAGQKIPNAAGTDGVLTVTKP